MFIEYLSIKFYLEGKSNVIKSWEDKSPNMENEFWTPWWYLDIIFKFLQIYLIFHEVMVFVINKLAWMRK